ncbi:MAG: Asp-tRNA(Asn)/Glu-tRNA(Gln) amidotransferase subunit GatA [Candidatus Omnitrophica bacterium]|nr:Asp-tRNA(Asn)/Glu-tRNA(Gln) amidotransferase subunit GatA [Candidatus Omnitrophota bacterium]
MTVFELQQMYRQGKTGPSEVVRELVKKVEVWEPAIHSLAWFDPEWLTRQAAALEKGTGPKGPLWGVPVVVKDNICVEGVPVTCASRILKGFRPPYNATVIERLQSAGALLAGMANMDEFAFGSSCEHSCYGPTRNPWDLSRVPGGSSGGSAASVAASIAPLALGSDTGGSIRQPASFCGVVGLKPTYGRVSRYGLIAFASSLDQIGPLARTVEDAALLSQVIFGFDQRDSTSGDLPVPDYLQQIKTGVKGLKVGLPKECFGKGLDAGVKTELEKAFEQCRALGIELREISLPRTDYAIPTYYVLATAEASSNLARFDGVQYGYRFPNASNLMELYAKTRGEGFGPEVKRRIILGTFVLSSGYYDAYYGHALKVRTLIKEDFDRAFEQVDCILTPTAPTPAFRLGEKLQDPLTMYLSDIFTISINLAGLPALSVPCGFTPEGLPVGLQWIGRPFQEEVLFRGAYAYQQAAGWHTKRPPEPKGASS